MGFKQNSPASSAHQMLLSSLGVEAPSFPKFPTFQELVDQFHVEQETPRPRDLGVFQALLGEPKILFEAWLDNPDIFDQRVGPLLLSLMAGRKMEDLSPTEFELLNAATLELAQYRPPPPKPVEQVVSKELTDPDEQPYDEPEIEWNERGGAAPQAPAPRALLELAETDVTKVPTRWWERGR